MKTILLLLALVSLPAGAQVTFQKWQDVGVYAGQQTVKLNTHTDQIAALRTEIDVLTSDMGLVIQRYDTLLRAIINNVCASNKLIVDNNWAATLIGLRPIGIAGHVCPGDAETARYYVPQYLSPNGPPIPPPATP
jgi:hypothetical protein